MWGVECNLKRQGPITQGIRNEVLCLGKKTMCAANGGWASSNCFLLWAVPHRVLHLQSEQLKMHLFQER